MSLTMDAQPVVEELERHRRAAETRLNAVRRSVRRRLVLEGAAWTVAALVALAAATLLADWFFPLDRPARIVLAALASIALVVLAYRKSVRPLLVDLADIDLAVLLNRHYPGIAHCVATVLQLPELLVGPFRASPAMVRAAVLKESAKLEETNLFGPLDDGRMRRFSALLAAVLIVPGLFVACWPGVARLWAERWLLGSNVRWPQQTYLALVGLGDEGSLVVPRGEPLVLQVIARPDSRRVPEQITLRCRSQAGTAKQGSFTRFATNDFRYELPPVQELLQLTITGGDDRLGPVSVQPIDRPTIETLTLIARDPGRPEGDTRTFDGTEAQLLFLPRTELELRLTTAAPVRAASLTAKTGQEPTLERIDARNYAARWTMSEALALEIQLVGELGGLHSKPYMLAIGLRKDREPRVTIRSSGVGPRVTPQARIPITLHAVDDIGLTELALEVERIGAAEPNSAATEKTTRIAVDAPTEEEANEADRETAVSLGTMGLAPGTAARLRGLAADNCADGSQTGYSRWLTFRIVTPEELFHEILMRQRAERAKFRAAFEMAKSQAAVLEGAVSPEDVDGLVRKHQVVERQVWQVANRLDASLTEMKLNDVGSAQAIELLQAQVITPIRALSSDSMGSMRKLLAQMTADRLNPEEHLDKARELEAEIVTTMQRILDQMSQWESFVDVVNQLRGILKAQNQVLESTEETRKQRTKAIFDE